VVLERTRPSNNDHMFFVKTASVEFIFSIRCLLKHTEKVTTTTAYYLPRKRRTKPTYSCISRYMISNKSPHVMHYIYF